MDYNIDRKRKEIKTMTIYTLAKYNNNTKNWMMVSQYSTFREANITMIEEGIIAIVQKGILIKKTKEFNNRWVGLLTKKEMSKVYVSENGELFRIKESEIF